MLITTQSLLYSSSFMHTADTISAVCITTCSQSALLASHLGDNLRITPWRQSSWCASYRANWLRGVHCTEETISAGVHHTTKSIFVVCITPRVKNTQYLKKLHSMHYTAESISAVCITSQNQTTHREVNIKIFLCLWYWTKKNSTFCF